MAKCSPASTLVHIYREKHPDRPALGITGSFNADLSNARYL